MAPGARKYYYLPASSILNQDGSTRSMELLKKGPTFWLVIKIKVLKLKLKSISDVVIHQGLMYSRCYFVMKRFNSSPLARLVSQVLVSCRETDDWAAAGCLSHRRAPSTSCHLLFPAPISSPLRTSDSASHFHVAPSHRWLAQRFVAHLRVLYPARAATHRLINCSYYFGGGGGQIIFCKRSANRPLFSSNEQNETNKRIKVLQRR